MNHATNWTEQILALAKERDLSLRELAADLGVSHVYLGSVVRGQKPASAKLKIKIWGRQSLDLTREKMLEMLLPDHIAEAFHAFELGRGRTRAPNVPVKTNKKRVVSSPRLEGCE